VARPERHRPPHVTVRATARAKLRLMIRVVLLLVLAAGVWPPAAACGANSSPGMHSCCCAKAGPQPCAPAKPCCTIKPASEKGIAPVTSILERMLPAGLTGAHAAIEAAAATFPATRPAPPCHTGPPGPRLPLRL
jgi:hypothetical protein